MKKSFVSFALYSLFMAVLLISFVSCDDDKKASTDNSSKTTSINSETKHTHDWGEWTVIDKATCQSEGKSERVCACGEKESKTTRVAHTSKEWIIDKQATLREAGKKHMVCSVCNQIFNERVVPRITVRRLDRIEDTEQEKYRLRYKLGNCRNLEGKPVVVAVFIDDNESSWTANEVTKFTDEQIVPALEFLEKSAKEWNVQLDFVLETYSTAFSGYEIKYEGVVNTNLNVGGTTKDLLTRAAKDIGCELDWDLHSYYKAKFPSDDIIFLCLLDKPGTSYARCSASPGYVDFTEQCIIFSEYLDMPHEPMREKGSRASLVAHEILHLFGAEDYYILDNRKNLASIYYPDDIMLLPYDKVSYNEIGSATAYTIGWTDVIPSVFRDPLWLK